MNRTQHKQRWRCKCPQTQEISGEVFFPISCEFLGIKENSKKNVLGISRLVFEVGGGESFLI